jgi:hypothetical protein
MLHSTSAKRAHQADTMGFGHNRGPVARPASPTFFVVKKWPTRNEDDFPQTFFFGSDTHQTENVTQ